ALLAASPSPCGDCATYGQSRSKTGEEIGDRGEISGRFIFVPVGHRDFKCCRRTTFRAVRQQMSETSLPLNVSSFRSFSATASINVQCCSTSFLHSASYSSEVRALSPSLRRSKAMQLLSPGDTCSRQSSFSNLA